MDRNIRRALYTALVAGGLVVVGASSAHAAGEDLLDPVTQGIAGTSAEAAATSGDLDAGEVTPPAGTGDDGAVGNDGADGADGLVGDVTGEDGILGSLVGADLVGVVEGTLGEDGLVDHLLGGVPPTDVEVPEPEAPGTDEPGVEEPGTEEPGTDEPGAEEPGTDEPGTEEPGTEEPGEGSHGPDEYEVVPVTTQPTPSRPGNGSSGSGSAGTGSSGADDQTAPGAEAPAGAAHGGAIPVSRGIDIGVPEAGTDAGAPVTDRVADSAPSAGTPDTTDDTRDGVDITWGDGAGVVDPTYDGSILTGELGKGLLGTSTTTEPTAKAEPVLVPGETPTRTGHLITGQLSLISLLLGLGIAMLRTRRR